MTVTVGEILVADPPEAWTAAGFSVSDGLCRVGGVGIRLVGREHGAGIIGWSLGGVDTTELDGIPTSISDAGSVAPAEHANGVTGIDHIVLFSPDLDRTVSALAAVGVPPRRERLGDLGGRPIRQIFFRFGAVIIEAVGSPDTVGQGPSTLWGITYTVTDIDGTAAYFAGRTTRVKDAVQPGRRITTVHHQEFGMSVRTAMLSAPILST
ncbi:glyoxalase [Mycobacterium frederiksbergense]|uniref:Glyoxalase n=1 Tax=Mycolicibacterium frederiksbergense TaxID=117567 RepID=A0A6H0S6V4_9MYCO|nr:glyoxalase [Mycolicibacterium frederiksbergense]MCV7045312.1 glyoxalase [Mycolicibacterium frederiksbergense]QIV83078.1 glyoxalase [Mycolicibacterium frederiksbergense]